MILLIDNYDSFAHNLGRYLRRLGADVVVVRNDQFTLNAIADQPPRAIVISPGPCTPDDAGLCLDVVDRFHVSIPMLGICLGHQAIAQALGAQIIRADEPVHGCQSWIAHDADPMFAGIPSPFPAGRYHSLIVDRDTMPPSLLPTAQLEDGTLMAFRHQTLPVFGLQFHPESILTQHGYQLLANFLSTVGINGTDAQRLETTELRSNPEPSDLVLPHPLTY